MTASGPKRLACTAGARPAGATRSRHRAERAFQPDAMRATMWSGCWHGFGRNRDCLPWKPLPVSFVSHAPLEPAWNGDAGGAWHGSVCGCGLWRGVVRRRGTKCVSDAGAKSRRSGRRGRPSAALSGVRPAGDPVGFGSDWRASAENCAQCHAIDFGRRRLTIPINAVVPVDQSNGLSAPSSRFDSDRSRRGG